MAFSSLRAAPERLVWDMVYPLAASVGNTFEVLARFYAAGHSYVSLTIAGDDCGLAETMHRIASARASIGRWPDQLLLARGVADVTAAQADGKLAVGLHLEGTECLERDPDVIDLLYELGIRHGILAFNQNNSAAGGCADLGDVGLSRLGRRYVTRMAQAGMLLDLSHSSVRTSMEAMTIIGRPVVFTHSNARALHDHYRNITDQQAVACAATGGLVGLSGSSGYIGDAPSLVDGLFRHLDHFVQLIGPDHVGLGTDYVVDAEALTALVAARPDEWPVDDVATHADMAYLPPESLEDLIGLMDRAGYDELAIRKILGLNYMRVCNEVWR